MKNYSILSKMTRAQKSQDKKTSKILIEKIFIQLIKILQMLVPIVGQTTEN